MPSPTETNKLIRSGLQTFGLGPIGNTADTWRVCLYDPFELLPAATQAAGNSYNWDLDGNGTEAVAFASTGGGITLTTAALAGNSAGVFALSGSQWGVNRTIGSGREHLLSGQISTPADVSSMGLFWGFKLTDTTGSAQPTVKTDANQVLIYYDTAGIDIDPATGQADIASGATNFYAVYSIGGSDYAVDLGVVVQASTEYEFEIRIIANGQAQIYINGVHRHTTPILTSANLKPTACVWSNGGARSLSLRWMKYLGK